MGKSQKTNKDLKTLFFITLIIVIISASIFLYIKFFNKDVTSEWNTKTTSVLSVKYPSDYTISNCFDYPTLVESTDDSKFEVADETSLYIHKDGVKVMISSYKGDMTLENGMCTSFLDSGRWISTNGTTLKEYKTQILEKSNRVFDFQEGTEVYGMIDKSNEEFSPNDGISICSSDNKCVYVRYIVEGRELYNQEFKTIQAIINSVTVDFSKF